VPDSKCISEILPSRPGPGKATSDLHLHGIEDKERKSGKLVPALRESDHVENFLLVPVASFETVLGLD